MIEPRMNLGWAITHRIEQAQDSCDVLALFSLLYVESPASIEKLQLQHQCTDLYFNCELRKWLGGRKYLGFLKGTFTKFCTQQRSRPLLIFATFCE